MFSCRSVLYLSKLNFSLLKRQQNMGRFLWCPVHILTFCKGTIKNSQNWSSGGDSNTIAVTDQLVIDKELACFKKKKCFRSLFSLNILTYFQGNLIPKWIKVSKHTKVISLLWKVRWPHWNPCHIVRNSHKHKMIYLFCFWSMGTYQ